jgi:hypothetical protein
MSSICGAQRIPNRVSVLSEAQALFEIEVIKVLSYACDFRAHSG